MNNDGGGDALRKAANLGSVDLDLSEVDDVSAIYDYFNSVLKEKPKSLDIGSVSFDETTPDSSTATALHGKGSVSDCFYHIHKHGSQLGVRLLLPALNRGSFFLILFSFLLFCPISSSPFVGCKVLAPLVGSSRVALGGLSLLSVQSWTLWMLIGFHFPSGIYCTWAQYRSNVCYAPYNSLCTYAGCLQVRKVRK